MKNIMVYANLRNGYFSISTFCQTHQTVNLPTIKHTMSLLNTKYLLVGHCTCVSIGAQEQYKMVIHKMFIEELNQKLQKIWQARSQLALDYSPNR